MGKGEGGGGKHNIHTSRAPPTQRLISDADTLHSINLDGGTEEGAASTRDPVKRRSDEDDDEVHHVVSGGTCLFGFLLSLNDVSGCCIFFKVC